MKDGNEEQEYKSKSNTLNKNLHNRIKEIYSRTFFS